MFWDDAELTPKRHARIRELPPIPETGWKAPREFPNLDAATIIAFDTETRDPKLNDEGPGWARGKGHIVGYSLAAQDRYGNRGAWYFPMRHEVEPEDNLDPAQCLAYAKYALENDVQKVGANATYDIGWFGEEGVNVKGQIEEIQFAEAILDSDAFVSLETLSQKYLKRGKQTNGLYEWCRAAYPNTPDDKWRADIYRSPPRLAGFYGEGDALNPLEIYLKQKPLLSAENFDHVYRLECDIIPLMIEMRRAGVTVNVRKAEELIDELKIEIEAIKLRIYHEFGFNIRKIGSPGELAKLFDHVGIQYPHTDAGNPSFVKEWLAGLTHPVGILVNDIREREKIISTFLQGYIIDKSIPIPGSPGYGKLFTQFHQLKSDAEHGTFLGRYSSSDPNLQNIPSRTELGKRVRECFEPDPGHAKWKKFDYSQIHYRILADNAVGPGSEELRERYRNDPKTDYHMDVYKGVAPLLNWSLTDESVIKAKRRPVKNYNFGLLYGQSIDSLAFKSGLSGKDAETFTNAYFKAAPYIKPTMAAIEAEMQSCGYVKTLLGRRIRFRLFEPVRRERGVQYTPLPYDAALRQYGAPLKYSFGYRAVNYKFQGTEPDIMKSGMRACYQSGVYHAVGVPRLTVHDENDFSQRDESPETIEAFKFIKHTMQETIKLRVPVYVDETNGPNWGKSD